MPQLELIPPIKVLGSGQFPVNWACEKSKPGFCMNKYFLESDAPKLGTRLRTPYIEKHIKELQK